MLTFTLSSFLSVKNNEKLSIQKNQKHIFEEQKTLSNEYVLCQETNRVKHKTILELSLQPNGLPNII